LDLFKDFDQTIMLSNKEIHWYEKESQGMDSTRFATQPR
jgi:hypothetical protein